MSRARANSINPSVSESAALGEVRPLLSLPGVAALVSGQDSSRHVTQSTSGQYAPPPVTLPAEAGSESVTISTSKTSNLLIIDSPKVDSIATIECGNPPALYQTTHLSRLAEIAYSRRDIEALEIIAGQLLNFSDRRSQGAGLYYRAIVAKRRGDDPRAIALLETVNSARAIQALGAIEFDAGRFEHALPLFIRAAQAAKGIDVATSLNALYQVSAIKSIAGNHGQALDDLLSLWPIVRSVIKSHPHLYFNWHNDVAFELLQVGRIQEARESLSVALTSPISASYPEYSETRAEIERCERRKIIVTVRKLKKVILTFRFCFIAKRRIITTGRLRLPVIKRTITQRVTLCARTHAPPFK
ncbi:MAG: hypothetical protein WBV94_31825 [Blastocatellia bacterium]